MLDLKDLLKNLPEGIDFATVEKLAKSLQNDPSLRKAYKDGLSHEGFEKIVEELADEVKDLFNHKDSK